MTHIRGADMLQGFKLINHFDIFPTQSTYYAL